MMILPYPISTNRYWRTFRGMTVVSEEAKAYKKQVAQIAQLSGCIKHNGNVSIDITLYPKRNKDGSASKVRLDLDNCLKVVLDALQGVAYNNDKQVVALTAKYANEPKENGGVKVCIEPQTFEKKMKTHWE